MKKKKARAMKICNDRNLINENIERAPRFKVELLQKNINSVKKNKKNNLLITCKEK